MKAAAALISQSKPVTLGTLLEDAARCLLDAGIEGASRESRWLIEHALGLTATQMIDRARVVDPEGLAKIEAAIDRRVAREPLQYILGTQEFCGLVFEVNPAVLIPRPETELLVQEVIRRLPQGGRPTIVDVGTGSGCIAVTLARAVPAARILATDLSAAALHTARRNARNHGVEAAICWLEGDLLAPLRQECGEGTVTAIVANPPYVSELEWSGLQPEVSRYEPRIALVGGTSGTDFHERLLNEAVPYLASGGWLAMEIGMGQGHSLRTIIEGMTAYERVEVLPDEAGIDRIVIVQRTR